MIENGAQVTAVGTENNPTPDNEKSYGVYFRWTQKLEKSPVRITGQNSSFIARGTRVALQVENANSDQPIIDDTYGVYTSRSYVNSDRENGGFGSVWGSTLGSYIVPDTDKKKARYLWIAEKPVITTTELSYGVIDQPYSFEVTAIGADAPFRWRTYYKDVLQFSDPTVGILSGMPTSLGKHTITVYAASSLGESKREFTYWVYSREEIHADAAQNTLTKGAGVSGSGTDTDPYVVTPGTDFSFTVQGNQDDMTPEVPGDTRFIPTDWSINPSGTFSGAPYVITTQLSKEGTYALTVNLREEVWMGDAWAATGVMDTKTIPIIAQANKDNGDDGGKGTNDRNDNSNKPGSGLSKTSDQQAVFPMMVLTSLLAVSALTLAMFRRKN